MRVILQQAVDVLSELEQAAMSSSQAAPSPDSVMSQESRRDEDLGDDSLPAPFGLAHFTHRAFVYAAGERLATLRWCLEADPYPHIFSITELARSAAEASATAVWLGAPEADGERRLQRLLFLMRKSHGAERGLRAAMGLRERDDGSQVVVEWAGRRGLKAESYGSREDLLKGCHPASASADYKQLSAVAHGTAFALYGTWIEVVAAQDGFREPINAHALTVSAVAASYALAGVGSVVHAAGIRDDFIAPLARSIDELFETAAHQARNASWSNP